MGIVSCIIDGISVRLNEAFGDAYPIYREKPGQGLPGQDLQGSCFYIFPINPSRTRMLGQRYRCQNPLGIHYFPQGGDRKNADMDDMADRLFQELEYITVDGNLVHGTKLHCEKADGALHFFVEYNMFLMREAEKINMEDMDSRYGIKG